MAGWVAAGRPSRTRPLCSKVLRSDAAVGLPRLVLITTLRAELGIDVPGILKRSRAVLTNRFKAGDVDSMDLGGPLVFATMLAAVHLLVRQHVTALLQSRARS